MSKWVAVIMVEFDDRGDAEYCAEVIEEYQDLDYFIRDDKVNRIKTTFVEVTDDSLTKSEALVYSSLHGSPTDSDPLP